nr:Protein F37A8.2 [Haemonchus contortus]
MNPQLLQNSPYHSFLPPILAALNITPEDCKLVANYDRSSNQTRFTFSVSWNNDNIDDDDDDRLTLSVRDYVDESSQAIQDPQAFMPKSSWKKNEMTKCDGPCGHTYPPESLDLLGRCGHFLCKVCHGLVQNDDGTRGCSNFDCVYATLYSYLPEDYARRAYESQIMSLRRAKERASGVRSSPSRSSFKENREQKERSGREKRSSPGTPHRSAKKSQSLTFVNRRGSKKGSPPPNRTPLDDDPKVLPLPRSYNQQSPPDVWSRKMRVLDEIFSDMTVSSSAQEGPTSEFELLHVRLMIFEPGPFKTIKRVHISREMSAALSVKEAIDELMDKRTRNIQHECPSRLYFCSENTSQGLRKITVEEFETARLWQYPARNSVLHFVLDAVGYLKGKRGD